MSFRMISMLHRHPPPDKETNELTEESLINASLEAKQMNLLQHLAGKSFPMTKVNVKPLILDRTLLDLIQSPPGPASSSVSG